MNYLSDPIVVLVGVGVMIALFVSLIITSRSTRIVGATEQGLLNKRFSIRNRTGTNPIAFAGEAGYQGKVLTAGLHWRTWPIYSMTLEPIPQVPPGEIGLVYAQIGKPLPASSRTAKTVGEIDIYANPSAFIQRGGEKGIQRQVLPPGTVMEIHPVAFLVITRNRVYGVPIDPELEGKARGSRLTYESFGLTEADLKVTLIEPEKDEKGVVRDMCGVVYAKDGASLPSGAIAGRIGGFADLEAAQAEPHTTDAQLVEMVLRDRNQDHQSYQNFQAFIDNGGCLGMQHDVLRAGTYNLNPFCVRVKKAPMLEVSQGQVAVIKAFEGLPTLDTSGKEFKYGSLVRPGRKGVWQEPLRTGKYAVNPRLYEHEIVPTAIVALNWATNQTSAHKLDQRLSSISARSQDGFVFVVDLVVQIHIPDTTAPKVISSVGTVPNLIDDVLQSAVGNHIRDSLQGMPAVDFIQKRSTVQAEARRVITERLAHYFIECKDVLIQDVLPPEDLTRVLKERTIADQQMATFGKQNEAELSRITLEATRGRAEMQKKLAEAQIGVEVAEKEAAAIKHRADGDAYQIEMTGTAEATKVERVGLAKAAGFEAQRRAIGELATAITNVADVLGQNKTQIVPQILSIGGEGGLGGLIGALTQRFAPAPAAPAPIPADHTPTETPEPSPHE